MNYDLFGGSINVWLDAFIRVNIIVLLMTVVVMGLIYLERKVIARFQMRLGPTRTGPAGLLQSVAEETLRQVCPPGVATNTDGIVNPGGVDDVADDVLEAAGRVTYLIGERILEIDFAGCH